MSEGKEPQVTNVTVTLSDAVTLLTINGQPVGPGPGKWETNP
jgi:hypothetical protein